VGDFLLAEDIMALEKRYDPATVEERLGAEWEASGTYAFDRTSDAPVYSIDTPPPTASGFLHLGHVYSYSHADFMARFRRMNGQNVFYPMGYDDNGLPTERLVERRLGVKAQDIGRSAFIARCLEMSAEMEAEYEAVWRRLGLSVDWQYTYRTIDEYSRRTSQLSFVDLFHKELAYRRKAPVIWCPECRTAIAQAEENDMTRGTEYVTMPFSLQNGGSVSISTTRPELLPACVAVFVHPEDARYTGLAGQTVTVPLFGQRVPILEDIRADPEKGTGAVMCCTFGDTTDVEWWYIHHLPLKEAIDQQGKMTSLAGEFAGMPVARARQRVKEALEERGLLLGRETTEQTIRVHERCDTPVEYVVTHQWFIRVLDQKERFIEVGRGIEWYPPHMETRYREWIENMHWDWAISRQRYFGVPFPVWYCSACGEIRVAEEASLPVDPTETLPETPCRCGGGEWAPERDVMDTWATSSMSPQIAGRMLRDPSLYEKVFPFSLRSQAHEIIRTWAFDTVVKSQYNFDAVPWGVVLISGWGLAQEGAGKISKSRGGGPMAPMEMLRRYSSDAARYWAASTGAGKDALISEEKIAAGSKLVTKLWNVARLAERFLEGYTPSVSPPSGLSVGDRWVLSRLQRLVASVTRSFEMYDYLAAKNEAEVFFWTVLTDNYLEMVKGRLYNADHPGHEAARWTVRRVLLTTIKLFAPIMPYVTDEIYGGLFDAGTSIHRSAWPEVEPGLIDFEQEALGEMAVQVASAVRRYKSEHALSLGAALPLLQVVAPTGMEAAIDDLKSVTRAEVVEVVDEIGPGVSEISGVGSEGVRVGIVGAQRSG
jgi:valyl-tRNA synthetase